MNLPEALGAQDRRDPHRQPLMDLLEDVWSPSVPLDAATDLHLRAARSLPLPPTGFRPLALAGPEAAGEALARLGLPTLAATGCPFLLSRGLAPEAPPLDPGFSLWRLWAPGEPDLRLLRAAEALEAIPHGHPLEAEDLLEAARLGHGLDLEADALAWPQPQGLLVTLGDPSALADLEAVGHAHGLTLTRLGTFNGLDRIRVPDGDDGWVVLEPADPPQPNPEGEPAVAVIPQGDLESRLEGWRPDAVEPSPLDHSLGGLTVLPPGEGEASLLALPGLALGLASARCTFDPAQDPFWAGAQAASQALLGLAATGAEPRGLAVRLPEAPGDASAREQAILGLRQALQAFDVPVMDLAVGGPGPEGLDVCAVGTLPDPAGPVNVSATDAKGLGSEGHHWAGRLPRAPFDGCFLVGSPSEAGPDGTTELALDEHGALIQLLQEGIRMGLIRSAALLGRVGLGPTAVALAVQAGLGLQLFLEARHPLDRPEPGQALLSASPEGEASLRQLAAQHRLPIRKLGVWGGPRISLCLDGVPAADIPRVPPVEEEDR